ncbi:LysR substrate-binding domain-containing protein [Limimaricola cinnabarinus]|uniref:LysR substrate-binding domain-containing protein n=1 Tax=Limimaricola cinnabarinus TaxID=1125964 RepID=UPI0024935BD1|nr:LysR substrate-binding domain-containing protein [Limimaricola cinnabarinus]
MSRRTALPPLNALRAFEAAGRHLTFRAAADELGVTQGAVAQHVRGLEAQLGLRMFLREARGLSLTEEGRGYHAAVSQAFAQLSEATARLRPAPGHVTISVTPTFASKWLIPRLPGFGAAHPEIDLRVMATERVTSFHSDGIDLAVRQGEPPFGASIRADPLFRQEILAVCAPDPAPDPVSGLTPPFGPEALPRLTLLHDTHDLWPRYLREAFPGIRAARARGIRFSQTTLGLDAALAGQGVALASRFLVNRDLAAGRLVQAMEYVLRGRRDFYLLASRSRMSPATAAARDWLLAQADPQ